MPAPYTGRCFCGSAKYRVAEEPLVVYACHCTDCQKRSGSAFGLSMWVHLAAISLTKGEVRADAPMAGRGRARSAPSATSGCGPSRRIGPGWR